MRVGVEIHWGALRLISSTRRSSAARCACPPTGAVDLAAMRLVTHATQSSFEKMTSAVVGRIVVRASSPSTKLSSYRWHVSWRHGSICAASWEASTSSDELPTTAAAGESTSVTKYHPWLMSSGVRLAPTSSKRRRSEPTHVLTVRTPWVACVSKEPKKAVSSCQSELAPSW